MHVVDFQGDVDQGSGYKRWEGTLKTDISLPNVTFSQGPFKYTVTFPDEAQIFWLPSPVEYGKALIGFLPIFGKLDGTANNARRYRVRVKDIFGHCFIGEADGNVARDYVLAKDGYGIRYLFEMAGAKVSREPMSHEEMHEE